MTTTYETDTFPTSAGDLSITFLGHGTLMLAFSGKIFHIDPYSRVADYAQLPKADVVLITHAHGDHLDPAALEQICTEKTAIIIAEVCTAQLPQGIVMRNGDTLTVGGVTVKAVPAYNILHKRPSGDPFHPKGEGNGYVLTFGDTKIYIAGDTENIPEMKTLKDITVAFLPMNLPYTMTPEMTADAARVFSPKILYPYHFGNTDTSQIQHLLANENIEVRIRRLS